MNGPADGPPSGREEAWAEDAKLTRAAARGDEAAQRRVLEQALPIIRHTARQLSRSSADVDDAVQASLLAVLQATPRFRGDSSLATWVTRITTRVTLRLMSKQRTLVPTETLEPLPSDPPEGRVEQIPRPISEYLDRLPHLQRDAIVLRYALDYTVDDIAEATEISRNTVKYRLKEALSTLRRLIRQDLAIRGKHHDR